jgi:hypothetical protein
MHTAPAPLRSSLFAFLLASLLPAMAAAQDPPDTPPDVRQPIGRFAADARGAMPRFKQTRAIADVIGVEPAALPSRGLGLVFGAHVYPLRMGPVTLGLGGEVMTSRATRTEEAGDDTAPDGPTVRTKFSALSPQISLNFGAREGWSYVSGGMGWSRFSVELVEEGTGTPAAGENDEPRRKTINYGGGARWFAKEHVAVSFDLRFYAVSPQLATATQPALPRMTVMVLSLGVGLK